MLPVPQLVGALGGGALWLAACWVWQRRLERHRCSVRAAYNLSEEIIAATSPRQIAEKLAASLPQVVDATASHLYVYNRQAKALERIVTAVDPEPMAAPLEDPPAGLANAAVVSFRNRTPLSIPDVRRNPLIQVQSVAGLPRSALFVPLLAQQEALGVLQADNSRRVGYFSRQDQATIQHLANQIGAALKLQEQQAMREQLFRGEKLAATGQLISAVARELQAPLESISQLAESLAQYAGQPAPEIDLLQLLAEAQRASEIVARLVSFAQQDSSQPRNVDISNVLEGLARFREPEWRALGLRVHKQAGALGAMVLGFEGQLAQVLLTLLVHAEQRAIASPARTVTLKTSRLAGRVLVEIDYSVSPTAEAEPDPFTDPPTPERSALTFDVCRGIVENHGGEIRLHRRPGALGFEVDLPAVEQEGETPASPPADASAGAGPFTLMLVDADAAAARQLMALLASRGHRVISAMPEEAAPMAQRLHFDAVFWSVRPGRTGWSEFHERVRTTVAAFVLISDGFNPELAASLEQSGGFLLARPVQEAALDRILGEIGVRAGAVSGS